MMQVIGYGCTLVLIIFFTVNPTLMTNKQDHTRQTSPSLTKSKPPLPNTKQVPHVDRSNITLLLMPSGFPDTPPSDHSEQYETFSYELTTPLMKEIQSALDLVDKQECENMMRIMQQPDSQTYYGGDHHVLACYVACVVDP